VLSKIGSTQQRVLGLIELGGEVIGAAAVGVDFLHHALVRLDDFFPAGTGLYTQDFMCLRHGHFSRIGPAGRLLAGLSTIVLCIFLSEPVDQRQVSEGADYARHERGDAAAEGVQPVHAPGGGEHHQGADDDTGRALEYQLLAFIRRRFGYLVPEQQADGDNS